MPLEIVAVDTGRLSGVERSAHQYFRGFGEKVYAQCVLWLIRGGEFPILVDYGTGTPELVKRHHNRELEQTPEQHPAAALRRLGVEPDEVRVIIQTHLHWDHNLGMELNLFPNADVFVQAEELRYTACPLPPHAGLYNPTVNKRLLPSYASDLRLKVMQGDYRIAPGVEVLHMPGHTPGLQAVAVDTAGGRYIIASDNVPWQTSWTGNGPADWVPTGIHVDLKDVYRSMARMADLSDHVLPSHDACVLEGGGVFPSPAPWQHAS